MKFKIADGIQTCAAAAKIADTKKVKILLDVSDRIEKEKDNVYEEYRKIVEQHLETKRDEQGTPILKDGEEIKFLSAEGRSKVDEIELNISLDDKERKIIKEAIDDIIGNVSLEKVEANLSFKRNFVELYYSI